MRKMTFIVFLIAFGFSAPAQTGKDNADGRVERELRKRCYEKTKSYTDFQRCIEMGAGQDCLKNRKSSLLYPCLDKKVYEKPWPTYPDLFRVRSEHYEPSE